ncbi:MAG: magnesium transporter [Erysipelotrichales bacterium]|nr:magnesium transporter [Erysipelotrichales bacterium]
MKFETLNLIKEVLAYLEVNNMDALKKLLNQTEDVIILDLIMELASDKQVIVFRLLSKEKSLLVFEQLNLDFQTRLFKAFTDEKAKEIIEKLAPDDRVRLLDELPAAVAKKLISTLSSEERETTNLLMGYEPQTAGRIMTPDYIRLERSMTVTEALEKVKKYAKIKEIIYTLYVTDEARSFEGVLSLRELLVAESNEKIESIMKFETIKVSINTDQEEVARTIKKYGLLAIPVVDKENRLVGVVSVDDAMHILELEATEDLFKKAGMTPGENGRSETMIKGSVFAVWKVRLPFLLLTLIGGLLAGAVIGGFEEVIGYITAAAIFIPVVMDMGGNVGVQSSTIFLRGALLGHIDEKKIKMHLLRETFLGFTMGLVVATVCGFVAFIWQAFWGIGVADGALLGLAVGLSIAIVMTFASFIGFLVPYILLKLNVDQAAATDPIITSIKDIVGLIIYFIFVVTLLGHLL